MNCGSDMRALLYKLLALVILITSLGLGWLWIDYQNFETTPLDIGPNALHFIVEPGMSVRAIADDLHQHGVLEHPRYFAWMARAQGVADHIKTGEYRIARGITPPQLLKQFVSGKVIQYSLTLVDGWTFREVMDAVAHDPVLVHTLKGLSDAAIMRRLGWPGEYPEGRFYPDTYHFPRGTTDVAFLQRAYRTMQRHLKREWAHRAVGLSLKTPYDALILASIIEKETALPSERRRIAGVFIRRLAKRMRLQTDPTVIYGMGTQYHGDLTRADLRRDTPYNTYRHRGLPPTPIAMPGLPALRAALHPAPGKALYFVARGDGSHQFSDTLKEHDRAVIKYQIDDRGRPFSSYTSTPRTKTLTDDKGATSTSEKASLSVRAHSHPPHTQQGAPP